MKIDVLGWIGQTASLYFDDDGPYWRRIAKLTDAERDSEKTLSNMPVALRVESTNQMKLTLFLTAMRTFIEGAAPEMMTWETLRHNEQPYVKISPTDKAHGPENLVIYYAAMPDALVISLNENVIKSAIDRKQARDKGQGTLPETRPWLGSNFCLQADAKVLALVGAMSSHQYRKQMQERAWANIPILNEWKRLYPDQDPVRLHERLWQTRLTCPGGGNYVWNEKDHTMESTVYGYPAAPRSGPAMPPILSQFVFGNFGMDFENGGLRARATLDRAPEKP